MEYGQDETACAPQVLMAAPNSYSRHRWGRQFCIGRPAGTHTLHARTASHTGVAGALCLGTYPEPIHAQCGSAGSYKGKPWTQGTLDWWTNSASFLLTLPHPRLNSHSLLYSAKGSSNQSHFLPGSLRMLNTYKHHPYPSPLLPGIALPNVLTTQDFNSCQLRIPGWAKTQLEWR